MLDFKSLPVFDAIVIGSWFDPPIHKEEESPGGEAGAFTETSLMNLGIKVP